MLAALGVAVFLVPLAGLLARTPWGDLPELLSSSVVVDALRLSLVTSIAAAAISVVLGVPLAWVLVADPVPGARAPPCRGDPPHGAAPRRRRRRALLFALGRRGLAGEPIDEATGVLLPFSSRPG